MKTSGFYYLMAWVIGGSFLAGAFAAYPSDYWWLCFGPLACAALDTIRLAIRADVWPFKG